MATVGTELVAARARRSRNTTWMLIAALVLSAVGAGAFMFMRDPGFSLPLGPNAEPTAITVEAPSTWRIVSRAPDPNSLLRSNEVDVQVTASDTGGSVETRSPSVSRVTPGEKGGAETLVATVELTRPARYFVKATTTSPVAPQAELVLEGPGATSIAGRILGVGAISFGVLSFVAWLVVGAAERSRRTARARRTTQASSWKARK